MKRIVHFIVLLVSTLFLTNEAFTQVSCGTSGYTNPLTAASGFNVFARQNVTFTSGNSDGTIAMGGNATLNGSFTVAMANSGSHPNAFNNTSNYGLVIGGGVTYTSGSTVVVNNGFLRLGSTTGSRIFYTDCNSATTNLRITKNTGGACLTDFQSTPRIDLQRQQTSPTATGSNGLDFTTAFTTLTNQSTTLSTYTSSAPCSTSLQIHNVGSGSISLTLSANKVNVINLTGSQLNAITQITFNNQPSATQPLVINVNQTTNFSWSPANLAAITNEAGRFVIFNFYNNTGTVTLTGSNTVVGSILVPSGHFTKNHVGNIEGQVVAQNIVLNGGEVHYQPFEACLINCTPTCTALTSGGTIAASQQYCASSSITPTSFTSSVNASGGTGGTIRYQWQKLESCGSFVDISGATLATFASPSITQTTIFRRKAWRDCSGGTGSNPVYSNEVTVLIVNAATISGNETGSCNFTPTAITGTNISINNYCLSNSTAQNQTYQWQQSIDGGSTWTSISGATLQNFTPGQLQQTTLYRRATTVSGFTCNSNVITKTVTTNSTLVSNESFPNTFNTGFTVPINSTFTGSIGTWNASSTNRLSTVVVNSLVFQSSPNGLKLVNYNNGAEVTSTTSTAQAPTIDLSTISSSNLAELSFRLYTYTLSSANTCYSFNVEYSSNSGSTWTNVYTKTAQELISLFGSSAWGTITLPIPSSYFNSTFRYRFTGVSRANCAYDSYVYLDDVRITSNQVCTPCPTSTSAGANQTKCANSTFTMAATAAPSGSTGTWSVVSGAATISSPNSATTNVTVTTSPATLRWTITTSNCGNITSDVVLTNNVATTSNAGLDQSKCGNNSFTMSANGVASGETGAWSVVSGAATITTTSSPTSSVTVTTSHATLRWTVTRGSCTTTDDVTLTVNPSFSIGNFVWFDANNNGLQDANETGVSNITLRLYADIDNNNLPDGAAIATTITNSTGGYSFSNLCTGRYIVSVVLPNGYVQGATNATSSYPNNLSANDNNGIAIFNTTEVRTNSINVITSNNNVDFGLRGILNLGNFVWSDTNDNGIQNSGEPGLAGLTVNLYEDKNLDSLADGAPVATTITNATGNYSFTNLIPGVYIIGVVSPNGFAGGLTTSTSHNPNNNNNTDNNAVLNIDGEMRSYGITLSVGGEPDSGIDGDGINGNLTLDFAFTPNKDLGNCTSGYALTSGGHIVEFLNVTYSGVFPNITSTFSYKVTSGFSPNISNFNFGNLICQSCMDNSSDFASVSSEGKYSTGTDPTTGICGIKYDYEINGGQSSTVSFTLAGYYDLGTITFGIKAGENIDYGPICGPVCSSNYLNLGNLVWNDLNNNGLKDSNEPGVTGVTVKLYTDADANNLPDGAAIATTTTDANGLYNFSNLIPGNYIVGVTLGSYSSTITTISSNNPNNNTDNDNNGVTVVSGELRSNFITLSLGGEPGTTIDGDGINGNLTLDFGLRGTLNLGNLVWNDTNGNGIKNTFESGVANVTVYLYQDTNGDNIPDGTEIATATTNASGIYNFSNLAPGNYIVGIVPPAGFTKSFTPTSGLTPNNDTDNDNNGIGTFNGIIRTNFITLSVGGEPASGVDGDGTNGNLTLDLAIAKDTDGDNIPDVIDIDDDNDGITDLNESGGYDPLADCDNDGTPNYLDQTPGCTTPLGNDPWGVSYKPLIWTDCNMDGINDFFDWDRDGIINELDLDSDNDGILDVIETRPNGIAFTSVSNGMITGTDTDGNGLLSSAENNNSNPILNGIAAQDMDRDGTPNFLDLDSDGDGITDLTEALGTYSSTGVVTGTDTDGDGVRAENFGSTAAATADNINGFGARGILLQDNDNDGKPNAYDIDTDNDGIADNAEGQSTCSYKLPTGNDCDGDGVDDAYDMGGCTSCLRTSGGITPFDKDGDGTPDYIDLDTDNDGSLDIYEGHSIPSSTGNVPPVNYWVGQLGDTDNDGLINFFDGFNIITATGGSYWRNVINNNMGNNGSFDTGSGATGSISQLPKSQVSNDCNIGDRDWRNITILPVTLIDFKGNLNNNVAKLVWSVTSEINMNQYQVERSADGINYTVVSTVIANNSNTTSLINYTASDNLIGFNGSTVYYRLKLVEKNGSFRNSNVISFKLNTVKGSVAIMPNPAISFVNIKVTAIKDGTAAVKIVDMLGKVVMLQNTKVLTGINTFTFNNLSALSAGTYTVQIMVDGQLFNEKLIVTK